MATSDLQLKQMRVRIVDPQHPHYPESGRLTGNTISVLGTPMTEVKLDACRHGTSGCFVTKGQIAIERRGANDES